MKCLLPFVALVLLTDSLYAQVNTLNADSPRENGTLKLGPFYVTPQIQLNEFGVDTNVFNKVGESNRDFTFTLTPMATVWLPIARRGLVKTVVDTDLVWYREFASERSVDPSVTLRGEAYVRRVTLFAQNAFLHSRQRPSFEVDRRSRRVENTFIAGVDVRMTPKVSLELQGSQTRVDYEGDAFEGATRLAETLNRTAVGFGGVARYKLSALTVFAIRAERFEDRFQFSPERDTDNVRIMPGVELHARALIRGSAHVGIRHLNPVDESVLPEFAGPVSDLRLSYTFLGSTAIALTQRRDIGYSFEALQPYYVDTSVGIHVRRALGSRFDAVASSGRSTYAYRDLLLPARFSSAQRIDTVWNYGGSVGYRLGREGRIGVGVSYWTRRSTTQFSRNYDGLRIGTTAAYEF